MKRILTAASAMALAGGLAIAQSEGVDSAMEMTCGQLAQVDLATSPGVVYYIGGYRAGD